MSGPQRYRKKPVEVEAMRLLAEPIARGAVKIDPADMIVAQASGWMLGNGFNRFRVHGEHRPFGIAIDTLEGTMVANPGDWIIRGVQGEFYPCKPDIFAATYEAVES